MLPFLEPYGGGRWAWGSYENSVSYIWMFQKIVVPPNHPFVHRVFHYFHHPFWGTIILGNPHMVINKRFKCDDSGPLCFSGLEVFRGQMAILRNEWISLIRLGTHGEIRMKYWAFPSKLEVFFPMWWEFIFVDKKSMCDDLTKGTVGLFMIKQVGFVWCRMFAWLWKIKGPGTFLV